MEADTKLRELATSWLGKDKITLDGISVPRCHDTHIARAECAEELIAVLNSLSTPAQAEWLEQNGVVAPTEPAVGAQPFDIFNVIGLLKSTIGCCSDEEPHQKISNNLWRAIEMLYNLAMLERGQVSPSDGEASEKISI